MEKFRYFDILLSPYTSKKVCVAKDLRNLININLKTQNYVNNCLFIYIFETKD